MRKLIHLVGLSAVLLVVCGAVGFFWLARSASDLDTSSKTYVDGAVVAIVTSWNTNELWKRSSPEFKRVSNRDDLGALFDSANRSLGKLVDYQGSQGQAIISKLLGAETTIRAQYQARGRFEKGPATLEITLHKVNDSWMIDGFHIQSTALMRQLTGQAS